MRETPIRPTRHKPPLQQLRCCQRVADPTVSYTTTTTFLCLSFSTKMPQDLPGFYFDAKKNRYFPIKGPIPGSNRTSSASSSAATFSEQETNPKPASNLCRRTRIRTAKLLQDRELYGNVIYSNKGKCNFQEEYYKRQASQPLVWKYRGTQRTCDCALEQIQVDKQTPEGQTETSVLLTGSTNRSLSVLEVGKIGQPFAYDVAFTPHPVWPVNIEIRDTCCVPEQIWRSVGSVKSMPSIVSSMKVIGKRFSHTIDEGSISRRALITTLGSETSRGSVHVLNLSEPLDFSRSNLNMRRRMHEVASFSCTIWTADCNSNGSQAVIGTNLGAMLVNMETGASSWVYRSKSDVLSQQLDKSVISNVLKVQYKWIQGNVILCGLRNGAIMTIDVRQKQEGFSATLAKDRIPYPHKSCEPSSSSARNSTKKWFEFKGNVDTSRAIFMPSSISCLVYLDSFEHYFLASSMDGSIKLYDHRKIQRGSVQSYEGHVNSYSRIQLGVDPSERFVMAGGEDCKSRIWSIKSGELLFEEKLLNSVPLTVCWPRTKRNLQVHDEKQSYEHYLNGHNNSSDAWLGSQDGLFHMHWP